MSLEPSPSPVSAPQHLPRRRATGASLAAVILLSVCLASLAFLHVVRRDVNPLRSVMSSYANGHDGMVMTVAFYALGLSSLAMAVRLRRAITTAGAARAFPVLLGLAGAGLIVAGVFEVDRSDMPHTIQETIHSNASIVAFALLTAAMLLFTWACRSDHRWQSFRWTSAALSGVTASAAVLTMVARQLGSSGGIQRLLGGSVLLWMLLAALHVRTTTFRSYEA